MPTVHRIEVFPTDLEHDPRARTLKQDAAARRLAVNVRTARVYLIESDDPPSLEELESRLLTDALTERASRGAQTPPAGWVSIEVHPLPGVMDPTAQAVSEAIDDVLGHHAQVSTGWRYDFEGVTIDEALALAKDLLANPVVHRIHEGAFHPEALPQGGSYTPAVTHIPMSDRDDAALETLSREAHLFLSLEEMRTIRDHYRRLGREPTDIELETLAQTWSEHCVHKTLKSTVSYRVQPGDRIDWSGRPGHRREGDVVEIDNLLRSTVAAATTELMDEGIDWTLSVFVDNAGIISMDAEHALCIKVETHNHPSALEPYGGSATGIGGCIRDVIGTGLAAKPIASTDVFCVARPDTEPPTGCLPPKRILTEVVAGVRDYGNRMGIPTVNGAVWFDDRYVGNPLVFCGCVGLLPRTMTHGAARDGDLIVALGGRTGRDGIHGATFSSAELTETHADEFSHAVQIGNAIEEKRVLDAILRARDGEHGPLFSAITDCGAGGFSSAVGEMGEELGAEVHLDRAPLKYNGLSYTEIWISEAQERMVLAVPEASLDKLRAICREEHVELAVLGVFGTPDRELILNYGNIEVGRLDMGFLHDGIPMPVRDATWTGSQRVPSARQEPDIGSALESLIAHPNIASKHWIIGQYDHEVQGNTVIKPLVGPRGIGPGDASVIQPVPDRPWGAAIGCGLATLVGDEDPYLMTLAAIDECVRNLVCVGADPDHIAILDNFCWPGCSDSAQMGALVRAAAGCYDGAKAYRTPFVSGKDSLNNQFTTEQGETIQIPATLLITGLARVTNIERCVTMDAKQPGNILFLVGETPDAMGCSHLLSLLGGNDDAPAVDLEVGPRTARGVARAMSNGLVASAHDVSDGGLLTAVAEMLIGSSSTESYGAMLDLAAVHADPIVAAFSEAPSRYVLEVEPSKRAALCEALDGIAIAEIGVLDSSGVLSWGSGERSVSHLAEAWRSTLDW